MKILPDRIKPLWAFFAICVMVPMIGACQTTRPVSYESLDRLEASPEEPADSRTVYYETMDRYYFLAPTCVFVKTVASADDVQAHPALVDALDRYLRSRFARVIARDELQQQLQDYALTMDEPDQLKTFARYESCPAVMQVEPWLDQDVELGIWYQKKLGVALSLQEVETGEILWQARHTTGRSDGSIPTSPLGLLVGVVQAANLRSDEEAIYSLADDIMRRIIKTLPDLRY